MAVIKKFRIKSFKEQETLLELQKVSMFYNKRQILNNLNLKINRQEVLGMLGPNGVGKSNLLEAVELLGSLRSHRSSNDQDLISWNEDRALLRATANDFEQLQLELRRRGGRQAYRNQKLLLRQLDLIGPLRCVGFSALDLELVRG